MLKLKFGKEDLILDTGSLAKQANGSVTVQYGGTVVLVTACMSRKLREGIDFFPLTVEYQEKTYAAGRIPGGFFKREGRPSGSEILTARLIDRPIRPLFPKGMLNDVQIMAIVLSSDGANDPDVLALNGASAALSISDIPFDGPLACCRVGRLEGQFVVNPAYKELEQSDIDIIVAGSKKGILMLESGCKEVSEEDYHAAVAFGFEKLQDIISLQEKFVAECGKAKTEEGIVFKKIDPALYQKIDEMAGGRLNKVYEKSGKEEREEEMSLISKDLEEALVPEGYLPQDISAGLRELEKVQVRNRILKENTRVDGRSFTQIRPISCAAAVLPRTHGSSLFTRGQTQSLAVTTLGTGEDEQLIEALEGEQYKRFMLHYNFPPFSVGETGPIRGPGRREIGHGALAERSLLPVMPGKEQFPYTIRVVSEILESNGSSSMATVCAASLALMDAGVPITSPVGGVALGLVSGEGEARILTDIAGVEDFFGDMDFKVAGTEKGVTAVQMDLKVDGISLDLLRKCLEQSRRARGEVLGRMKEALVAPREDLSAYAPRIETLKVDPEKIGGLIGPGGKTIKGIIASTGVTVDIQDDGTVLIGSTDAAQSEEAKKMIRAITDDIEVGRVYKGKVKRIMNFGAFCEIAPRKEGLVHVSELAGHFVKNVADEVKIGDEFDVKVIGIDEQGRINLSRKQASEDTKP